MSIQEVGSHEEAARSGGPPMVRPQKSREDPQGALRGAFLRIVGAAATCAVLVVISVALIDRPVATWVHAHLGDARFGWFRESYAGHTLSIGPFSLMASPAEALKPLAALIFAALAIFASSGRGQGVRVRVGLALCLSVFASAEINGLAKEIFGRTWPESLFGDNPSWVRDGVFGFFPFHDGLGWASFPSGHTTAITTVATILWVVWPRLKMAWSALVAMVAAGLLLANYHFVSDIIAGVYLGVAIGLAIAKLTLSSNDPRIAVDKTGPLFEASKRTWPRASWRR